MKGPEPDRSSIPKFEPSSTDPQQPYKAPPWTPEEVQQHGQQVADALKRRLRQKASR